MSDYKSLLQFIMEGGSVVRYHTRPGLRPDTDAHHSHGVLMLASIISGVDAAGRTKASAMLLMACATHDLAEQYASDVSAGTKQALGMGEELGRVERRKLAEWGLDYESALTPDETAVLKLADQLDCLMYCCREASLGNRNVKLIWGRTCARLEAYAAADDLDIDIALRASHAYEAVKDIWREANGPSGPAFNVFAKR